MDAYALDNNFNLVAYGVPYDNLQWDRKYYDFGQFMMQMPLAQYDSSWAYVGLSERRELGMVQKSVYQGTDTVILSGFFCEQMLNRKACYPRMIGSYSSYEAASRAIFENYRDFLPVKAGTPNSPLLGVPEGGVIQVDIVDDQLGTKLYSLLESAGLSYRVRYDYRANELLFEVWQGLDRTQEQDANSTQVFSADFGNIGDRTINRDQSDYKNYAIVPYDEDDLGVEQNTLIIDLRTDGEEKREILIDMRSSHPEDRQTYAEFQEAVRQSATEKLSNYAKVEDIDVEMLSDKGYLEDYDLGDMCDIVFRDVDLRLQARIIEVSEVFKKEGHEITVGLGNKRISRLRRAVLKR